MLARMLNAGLNGLGAALCWSMKLPMSVLGCQSAFKFWTPIPAQGANIAGRMTVLICVVAACISFRATSAWEINGGPENQYRSEFAVLFRMVAIWRATENKTANSYVIEIAI